MWMRPFCLQRRRTSQHTQSTQKPHKCIYTHTHHHLLKQSGLCLPIYSSSISSLISPQRCEVSRITTVGETPEKKLNRDSARPATAQKMSTKCIVADSRSSSWLSATENAHSKRKKPACKVTGKFHVCWKTITLNLRVVVNWRGCTSHLHGPTFPNVNE